MRVITSHEIDDLIDQAARLPRRRTILRLHEYPDPVQRMVNAVHPGSYITPHKHEAPDKVELFAILRGRVALLRFTPVGAVDTVIVLDSQGLNRVVDIPPRVYHSLIALEPAALLEIIQGPYEAATHKQFAPWAPAEDSPKAADYYLYLMSILHNYAAT
ncbi:MAG: WbuC family cupin fold metalloprotein [Anaerolineae bacterium]|jgi:cupin fold WbuC family metalloprotein|nr:WbuC family cupin fold metalloprotein [Anaerolineae bacterium]